MSVVWVAVEIVFFSQEFLFGKVFDPAHSRHFPLAEVFSCILEAYI